MKVLLNDIKYGACQYLKHITCGGNVIKTFNDSLE